MSPTIQKWLVRGLAGIITTGLDHWLSDRLIEERPPKQRSIQEDVKEAAFHAAVSAGAIVIASVLVRRLLSGASERSERFTDSGKRRSSSG